MSRIIADRSEFVEALRLLRIGHTLVLIDDEGGYKKATIDGMIVYHSMRVLAEYELIAEYDNPRGFPNVKYFRITEAGDEFATRIVEAWNKFTFIERFMVRWRG